MAISPILSDGGHLPASAAAPTASQLLADYTALATDAKAAFRQAIAPLNYADLESTGAIAGEDTNNARPGDTATVQDEGGMLFRLAGDQSDPAAWTDILSGDVLEASSSPSPIDGDGGKLPGEPAGRSRLAQVWDAMSRAQRTAFLLAIKPAYSTVSNQVARLALSGRVPGDYCRQSDLGLLRLRTLPATVDGNWDILHTT